MNNELAELYEFAAETVYLAGRLTLGYFRAGVQVDTKGDQSPVTIADRQAETLIRGRIEQRYPRDAIIGEEHGTKESDGSQRRWFIDPIDGTKSFVRGIPAYGVLLGLEIEGKIEVGAAYFPASDDLISAAAGMGCWWNGRRSRVSSVGRLAESYLSCTDSGAFARLGRKNAWERIQAASYFRTGWGDAYGYFLVAAGKIEVMLDPIMAPWDCGPFPIILSEAGGYFGDWQGNATVFGGEGLATNAAVRDEVLQALNDD